MMGAVQMRNEAVTEKEGMVEEKEQLLLENQNLIRAKQSLERELSLRTGFARTACETLQNRIKSELHDKKMLYGFVMALIGVMVAILFAVILKK
ncbi:unnamed protein product [Urochloa humidicola]